MMMMIMIGSGLARQQSPHLLVIPDKQARLWWQKNDSVNCCMLLGEGKNLKKMAKML